MSKSYRIPCISRSSAKKVSLETPTVSTWLFSKSGSYIVRYFAATVEIVSARNPEKSTLIPKRFTIPDPNRMEDKVADELTETETMTGDRLRVPCGWEGLWGFNGLCGVRV